METQFREARARDCTGQKGVHKTVKIRRLAGRKQIRGDAHVVRRAHIGTLEALGDFAQYRKSKFVSDQMTRQVNLPNARPSTG